MTKILTTSALATAILLAAAAPLYSRAAGGEAVARTERGQLVRDLVLRWGPHVQETYKTKISYWTGGMRDTFANVPIENLRRAAAADNFNVVSEHLNAGSGNAKIAPKALGDINRDLVFVPITPCRILDTRVAGGAIAANVVRGVDVTAVSSYAFQGGANSDCGGAGSAGSFAAAAINFTVVTPSAAGYITAYPVNGTQPLAATVNYSAGDIRGNFAIVQLDQGPAANEMNVYSFAQTHLVADLVGYYINPVLSNVAPDCVQTAAGTTINAGGTGNATAPACAAGYTQLDTGCESSSWDMPMVFINSGVCSAKNNGAAAAQLTAARKCCRVPPR